MNNFNILPQLFDQRWHKIMLGVTENQAKLWVDCKPVRSTVGELESPLQQRGRYDIENGRLSIAQIAKNRRRNYYSSPVREKFMILRTFIFQIHFLHSD